MSNPVSDTFEFLIGHTGDYDRFGPEKYVSVAFYLLVLAAGLYIARLNWAEDPGQRSVKHLSIMAMRVMAAGMWFQGTIWKLPLPVSAGFRFWLGLEGKFSAIPLHAAIVRDVLVPQIALLQTPVYLLEIWFTVSLTLGIALRLTGVIAVLFTLQLWIGLYNDPSEWPWTYMAIVFGHGMFAAAEAGRSLGFDNLVRLRAQSFVRGQGLLSTVYRLAS